MKLLFKINDIVYIEHLNYIGIITWIQGKTFENDQDDIKYEIWYKHYVNESDISKVQKKDIKNLRNKTIY